jgi:hypothetical protein
VALALRCTAGVGVYMPAFAAEDGWHDRGRAHHERERREHHHHSRGYYVQPAPPVVYAPPPVVYVPSPPPSPGINIVFPIHIR